MSVRPSSAEELPSRHWCLSSLSQQISFPVSIGVCPAYLSRRAWSMSSLSQEKSFPVKICVCPVSIASGQPSSAEELPSKHWVSVQPSLVEELGGCPAFLSKRAPSKHWCLSSLPQQKSFPVDIGICPAFLSRELPVTLVSVKPSSVKELGDCPAFLTRSASQ